MASASQAERPSIQTMLVSLSSAAVTQAATHTRESAVYYLPVIQSLLGQNVSMNKQLINDTLTV